RAREAVRRRISHLTGERSRRHAPRRACARAHRRSRDIAPDGVRCDRGAARRPADRARPRASDDRRLSGDRRRRERGPRPPVLAAARRHGAVCRSFAIAWWRGARYGRDVRAVAVAVIITSGTAFAEPDPGTLADANAGHVWIVPTALVP